MPGEAFYDWQKHDENFVPVVRVRARPKVKMKLVGSGKDPSGNHRTGFEGELAIDASDEALLALAP